MDYLNDVDKILRTNDEGIINSNEDFWLNKCLYSINSK